MSKPRQPRKELTSLRLEPQVKYLSEIAARIQRRSLTNFIEWVLEESLNRIEARPGVLSDGRTIGDLALQLWDVDESERLIKLALIAPELLIHEEQLIFKIIIANEYKFLNFEKYSVVIIDNNYQLQLYNEAGYLEDYSLTIDHFNIPRIQLFWDHIVNAANGDKEAIRSIIDNAPF